MECIHIKFITAVIPVVGTISGVFIGSWLSRKSAQDLLARQAKAEFAASFTDTLVKLACPTKESRSGRAMYILKEACPIHLAAYIKLRNTLSVRQQNPIDNAWRNYTGDENYDLAIERELYRFVHILKPETDEHQFMIATKHINTLLARIMA